MRVENRRAGFLAVATLAALASQGCATEGYHAIHGIGLYQQWGVPAVPAAEIDVRGIELEKIQSLGQGSWDESIVAILGEPADKQVSCVPHRVVWRYPVRAWNDMARTSRVVHAALLRTRFDKDDVLVEWAFVDPLTERALPVRETPEEAARWFESLKRGTTLPPRVVLSRFLTNGRITRAKVEQTLGQWRPDLYCRNGGSVPVVARSLTGTGVVLDWFVDRPSPLFIPPGYLIAEFDDIGTLVAWYLAATYPGVKTER